MSQMETAKHEATRALPRSDYKSNADQDPEKRARQTRMTITTETISMFSYFGDAPRGEECETHTQGEIRPFLCPSDRLQTQSMVGKPLERWSTAFSDAHQIIQTDCQKGNHLDPNAPKDRDRLQLVLGVRDVKRVTESKKKPLMKRVIAIYKKRRSSGRGTLAW